MKKHHYSYLESAPYTNRTCNSAWLFSSFNFVFDSSCSSQTPSVCQRPRGLKNIHSTLQYFGDCQALIAFHSEGNYMKSLLPFTKIQRLVKCKTGGQFYPSLWSWQRYFKPPQEKKSVWVILLDPQWLQKPSLHLVTCRNIRQHPHLHFCLALLKVQLDLPQLLRFSVHIFLHQVMSR